MKSKLTGALLVIMFILAIWFRITYYGSLRLSVATNDTGGYIASSRSPLFSWKSFAGQRLFSTNLIYKLANNEEKCKVTAISYPAIGKESSRKIQPCFDRITLIQNILGIASWCYLAWVTARCLNNPFLKIVTSLIILTFGFVPQIAEWDSVLSIESFTISFFILTIALLQEIVFLTTIKKETISSKKVFTLSVLWLVVYVFWVFLRDVHLYTVPLTIAFILIVWLIYNKQQKRTSLVFLTVFLIGIFILGYASARDSIRGTAPLLHPFERYIAPFPPRMDFFRKFGMPEQDSPQFIEWFDYNATKTYGLFLLSHPRFILSTLIERQVYLRLNYSQPYYPVHDTKTQINLIQIGEMVHPESLSIFLVLFILLIVFWIIAHKSNNPWLTGWAWLTSWVFICAAIVLFLNFFGDVDGTFRHVFPPVEIIRLSVWLNLAIILDHAIGT